MEIDYNKLDKNMPGIVIKHDVDHKCYKYSEVLYYDGLTGDTNEDEELYANWGE